MRHVPLFLVLVQIAALTSACAGLDACPPGQRLINDECTAPSDPCIGKISKPIPVGCVLNVKTGDSGGVAYVTYELDVEPLSAIESGEPIHVSLGGRALIGSDILNLAQTVLADAIPDFAGFRRLAIEEWQATVQVRRGAKGDDVVLKASFPIEEKTCTYDQDGNNGPDAGPFPSCLDDDDCTGLGDAPNSANRCLSFVPLETNDECDPGGQCETLGQTGPGGPCEKNGFCVTDSVEMSLEQDDAFYTAARSGSVLFGWAERGNDLLEAGPNRGAYDPEKIRKSPNEPLGPNGARFRIAGLPFAFECVMGVNSRGPDGVPTIDPLLSPSPDGILISCPIQEPD